MASVPNMRLSPNSRPGVVDQPGDGGEGEEFAHLLSATVPKPGEPGARPKATAPSDEDSPATGGQVEPIAQADAILSLVALPATPAPASGAPGIPSAAPVLAPSSALPGATVGPAKAATPTTPVAAGAGIQPGTDAVAPAATAPTTSSSTTAGAAAIVTLPTATTQASSTAVAATAATATSGSDIPGTPSDGRVMAAPDAAPVLTGPARRAAMPGGKASETPLAVSIAATARQASAAAVKSGEILAPAQPDSISRTAAAKVAPVVAERAAAIAPGAATVAGNAMPAATARPGSGDPARPASMNTVLPKGEAVAAQAPAQTAVPVVPPFAPAMAAEAPIASSLITGGPAPATAPEAMIERQLELAADGEWLDRLARDIAAAGGTEGKMRFRLDPEHLGTLRVELAQSERGTSVRLIVESEAARAIIADAQPKLAAEARAQGVRLAETHVDLAGGHAGDPRRQEAERRSPQLRTARESSPPAEPERQARSSSDRYA